MLQIASTKRNDASSFWDRAHDEIVPKLGFLNDWAKKDVSIPEMPAATKVDKTKIYLVNKDERRTKSSGKGPKVDEKGPKVDAKGQG